MEQDYSLGSNPGSCNDVKPKIIVFAKKIIMSFEAA